MWGYPSVNGYLNTVNLVGLPRHCCPVTCYSAAHALMTHGTGSRYLSTLQGLRCHTGMPQNVPVKPAKPVFSKKHSFLDHFG